MLLQQLDRIESELKHKASMDELRWAELFRRFTEPVEESELENSDGDQAA